MNRITIIKLIVCAVIVAAMTGGSAYLDAQTCSCAGAPVFNPLDYARTGKDKKWRFELTYKYHAINDLVEGSKKKFNDVDRRRISQTVFLETRYSFSPRLAVIANINFTGHQREVSFSSSSAVNTGGLGDSMLSLQYSPLLFSTESASELAIGGGVKFPTGRSNVKTIGIASEDMQPGTGSWDVVGWVYFSRKISLVKGMELFSGVSYRANGANKREYSFGNEFTAALGTKFLTKGFLDYSLYARYRWADSDQRFEGDIPNTGGNWVYLVPSLTFKISNAFGFRTRAEIPVYRKLNGSLQFTTTFSVSVSMFYEM
ncbi:MAG: hypothetical protein GY950_32680 [bacterium]|nr:hypothetical protein [bacterium]